MSKAKIEVHRKVRVDLKNSVVFGKIVETTDTDLFYLETAKGERFKFYAQIDKVTPMTDIEIVEYYLDKLGLAYSGFGGSDYDHLIIEGNCSYDMNINIETFEDTITYEFWTTHKERLQREYEKPSWDQEISKADGNHMTRKSVGALITLVEKWMDK